MYYGANPAYSDNGKADKLYIPAGITRLAHQIEKILNARDAVIPRWNRPERKVNPSGNSIHEHAKSESYQANAEKAAEDVAQKHLSGSGVNQTG
jgi:hypothetical protein